MEAQEIYNLKDSISVNSQDKKSSENLIQRLGEYGVEGGPGRPRGSKNKFSQIKEEILEVWTEENGKERFRKLFNGNTRDFIKALDVIVSLIPKEQLGGIESLDSKHITYCWIEGPKKDS